MIGFIELSHFDVGGRSKGEDKNVKMCQRLYSKVRFLERQNINQHSSGLPVGVENVIILIHGDSLAVKRDGSLKVTSLTCGIALANFFKEQGFICLASGSPAGIFMLKQKENVK